MKRATSQAAAAQPRASFQWDAILRWVATVHVRLLLTVTDDKLENYASEMLPLSLD